MADNNTINNRLDELRIAWLEIHDRLRVQEASLSEAVALYARGEGPWPQVMADEVVEMRAQCALRFEAMMKALRDIR